MKQYRVTPRARDDLRNIALYSQQQWGRAQRNKYLKLLEQRFEWIVEHPLLGKSRSDIGVGYYSCLQGEHVVFYRINGDTIEIIGVLHQEMDIAIYFNNQ